MSLLAELKRRNVLRAAGAYVALSWLVIQVTETLLPAFGLADTVLRTVLIVLAVGFIPAIIAAWAFELTPQGLVRDADVDRDSVAGRQRDKRMDRVVIVLLALAVGYFALDKFLLDPARDRAREEAAAQAAVEAARTELAERSAAADAGPSTLAVLPFAAIGSGDESEVFALGVHDDLLTRLAKLGDLRVLSRTSVMRYRDTTMHLRDIGEALGADVILEGGVQSAGNRIRINAQLIEAASDEHLWAETYDRELTAASIFEVQADIAGAIASALQTTMRGAEDTALIPTDNIAAYRAFHEAMAMRNENPGVVNDPEYREALRRAIELDPRFARPMAELVGALSYDYFHGVTDSVEEVETLLGRLAASAPNSAEHLIAQSYYTYYVLRDYDLARDVIERAQARAPSDLRLLELKGWIQRRQGDYEGKLATNQLQRSLDPENPGYVSAVVATLAMLHRYDEAGRLLEATTLDSLSLDISRALLSIREHGDLRRYADEVAAIWGDSNNPRAIRSRAEDYLAARAYDEAKPLIEALPAEQPVPRRHFGIENRDYLALELYALAGIRAAGFPDLSRLQEEAEQGEDGDAQDPTQLLGHALVAVVSGDREHAISLIQQWQRESDVDKAERLSAFSNACRTLGLAQAAQEAVDCLRAGLSEPSFVTPFIDPLLPHYDGIRDSEPFQALVSEL